MNNIYVVILAGGKGERLWPLSRKNLPKQLLPLSKNSSLLKKTIKRAHSIVEKEKVWIITTKEQEQQIRKHVGNDVGMILAEPGSRNTGPAILYTCYTIQEQNPNATIVFLPADHIISPTDLFAHNIKQAISFAQQNDCISLLGLKPTYPAPGFGYIEYTINNIQDDADLFNIKKFHEKPSLEQAIQYNNNTHMLWNIGIFAACIKTFIQEFELHASNMYKQMQEFINNTLSYESIENISIDYAVMEKSSKTFVLPVSFSWSDVGNLNTFLTMQPNQTAENIISIESKNNIIQADDKLVALIGIEDLCVVHTDDVLLVSKRTDVEKVKLILKQLKKNNKERYL